ncbi:MAG: type II toxin-antitoxin system VapC family toxin [Terracidiphilus sp.]|jgi:predicted nucleic acid-binding protein
MSVLLDTNILLRISQPHSSQAPIAERALRVLRFRGENLQIVSQNLVEFWAVATRPIVENGLGFSPEMAGQQLQSLKRLFTLLPEAPLQLEWERLVATENVSGKSIHDARLVAAMNVHGIPGILTFNMQDFTRFPGISVLDPRMVI